MSDKRPPPESNEIMDSKPWCWLARVPCTRWDELGNPYPGTAEFRLSLLSGEGIQSEGFDRIHLHGLYPMGPLRDSHQAEQFGGCSLEPDGARVLSEALSRAADAVDRCSDDPDHGQIEWLEREIAAWARQWRNANKAANEQRIRAARAESMLERVLAGFQAAAVEPERLISIVNNLHNRMVHLLSGGDVDGLSESDGPTAETYERAAAWAARRAARLREGEP